jgi:putative membrane protein
MRPAWERFDDRLVSSRLRRLRARNLADKTVRTYADSPRALVKLTGADDVGIDGPPIPASWPIHLCAYDCAMGGGSDKRDGVGREPDYRFTLANERTFLAWIRTALALDAAGLALVQLFPPFAFLGAREAVGVTLVVLGSIVAAGSHRRWARNEAAMRHDEPLPRSRLPAVLALAVSVASIVAVMLLVLRGPG